MPGPPPKPEHSRQGHRTRPQITVVPTGPAPIEVLIPDLPQELQLRKPLPQTVEKWEAYWQSSVARIALKSGGLDLAGLHRWIINVEEWHRAMRAFRSKRIVAGSTGQPRLNPLAEYITSREAAIKTAEDAYGMTPLARMKLGIAVGQASLTAQELNKALEDNGERHGDGGSSSADELDAEWEEADSGT